VTERLPTAILAGGLATRLRPVTETIPKALVDVAGEPFLYHQLRLLRANSVTRAVVCVGYLGEQIQDCLRAWNDPNLRVEVSFDGPQLLGTAGALRRALPLLGDAFFVLYGDSYLLCDFGRVQRAFERSGRAALMTVFRNDGRWERSNVEFRNGRLLHYDKNAPSPRMQHIDYGLGVLRRDALDEVVENQPGDLAILYQRLLARKQLAGLEVPERFYEIGSFEGLEATRSLLTPQTLGAGSAT
jgi:N-acetyl-alpha-D-muramate 1-phosphate uridylyltransferase